MVDWRRVVRVFRKAFGVFLAAGYVLAVVCAEIGGFLIKTRSLALYGALVVVSLFVPAIGIFLVGCLFMWLNRPIWDPAV